MLSFFDFFDEDFLGDGGDGDFLVDDDFWSLVADVVFFLEDGAIDFAGFFFGFEVDAVQELLVCRTLCYNEFLDLQINEACMYTECLHRPFRV